MVSDDRIPYSHLFVNPLFNFLWTFLTTNANQCIFCKKALDKFSSDSINLYWNIPFDKNCKEVLIVKTDKTAENKYIIPSVEKAFAVLEHILLSEAGCSFNEIMGELHLPKTTAFTILNTLCHCGYIEKNSDKLYVPTIRTYSLGVNAKNFILKNHVFTQALEHLRDTTRFTTFLSIYDNGEKVTVEKADGFGAFIFRAYVGERTNLNTSAAGKAIAAYLEPGELELVISKGLKRMTENSICDEKEFCAHLAMIRQQGYSLDNGEDDVSLRCLGMPVFMSGGSIFGSVSISTTKENLPLEKIRTYVDILRVTAELISTRLGFSGSYTQRLSRP